MRCLRRGDVYIADKIGERGEPWRVPWLRMIGSDLKPLKERQMQQLERKEQSQEQRERGKPRS